MFLDNMPFMYDWILSEKKKKVCAPKKGLALKCSQRTKVKRLKVKLEQIKVHKIENNWTKLKLLFKK